MTTIKAFIKNHPVAMDLYKFSIHLALAFLLTGVSGLAHAQSMDELYRAAMKEGELSLNGGGPVGLYEPGSWNSSSAFPVSRSN